MARTVSNMRRDLLGLLGDVEPTPANPGKGAALKPAVATAAPTTVPQLMNHDATTLRAAQPTPTKRLNTVTLTSVSTLDLVEAVTITSADTPPSPTMTANSATDSFSTVTYPNLEDEQEAPATPPGELTEWKVIGIAVTTITFFATVVLSVVFFDSWWGFLRAAICGSKRAKKGEETLVPDWSKRSWEFKLASEDGHRYPTMASLESIVKEKDRARCRDDEDGSGHAAYDIKSPEVAYGGF